MFTIDSENRIEVIKGDTGVIELALDNYNLKDGDKVYFTVKANYDSERLIFKEITSFVDGKVKFEFSPEDTNIAIGMYLYDVQCNLADGRVDTVIKPNSFKILGGITDV